MEKISKELYADLFGYASVEDISEDRWRMCVILDGVECSECGSDVYIQQDPKAFDAAVGCTKKNCDTKEILR